VRGVDGPVAGSVDAVLIGLVRALDQVSDLQRRALILVSGHSSLTEFRLMP